MDAFFNFLANIFRSMENMYTVGAENGSVGIDYVRVIGITIILGIASYGFMLMQMSLGDVAKIIATAFANAVTVLATGAGNLLTSIGKAIELVAGGFGKLLSFISIVAEKAAEVRIAFINATKRTIKVTMVDGERSLTVDISGEVENPDRILSAAADAGGKVYTRSMERMLTQKPRVIEGEVVE